MYLKIQFDDDYDDNLFMWVYGNSNNNFKRCALEFCKWYFVAITEVDDIDDNDEVQW